MKSIEGGFNMILLLLMVVCFSTCRCQADVDPSFSMKNGTNNIRGGNKEGGAKKDAIQVTAFTNENYAPLAKEWYDRLTKLGYTSHVIVATDRKTKNLFEKLSSRTNGQKYRVDYQPLETFALDAFWKLRMNYLRKKLQEGTSVLLMDTDIIISKKFDLQEFADSPYDMYHSYGTTFPMDVYMDQGFVFCGCFGVYKATPNALDLLDRIVERVDADLFDDQRAMNRIYSNELEMKWTPRIHGKVERTGESQVTGLKVKVLSEEDVWRQRLDGPLCPFEDGIGSKEKIPALVMPQARKTVEAKVEVLQQFHEQCMKPAKNA